MNRQVVQEYNVEVVHLQVNVATDEGEDFVSHQEDITEGQISQHQGPVQMLLDKRNPSQTET